jgi:hypothetical protein
MSYVSVKRPTDHLVTWSLGHLTNTHDMGHWTSQHLTAGSAKLTPSDRAGLRSSKIETENARRSLHIDMNTRNVYAARNRKTLKSLQSQVEGVCEEKPFWD